MATINPIMPTNTKRWLAVSWHVWWALAWIGFSVLIGLAVDVRLHETEIALAFSLNTLIIGLLPALFALYQDEAAREQDTDDYVSRYYLLYTI